MSNVVYFERSTWPEIVALATTDPVVVVPAGTIEQHGPHLPVDTDNRIAAGFALAAAQAAEPRSLVVGPPLLFGLSRHLADFPGAVYHSTSTMISVVVEVLSAIAQSGFRRVLVVNAHGSNVAPIELAALEALHLHPEAQFASVSWWELDSIQRVASEFGPSTPASHACAYETSLMLSLAPETVHMELAVPGDEYPSSRHIWRDMFGRRPDPTTARPIRVPEYWNGWSKNGIRGNPIEASADLGTRLLQAGGAELAEIVEELRARPILGRPAVTPLPDPYVSES